ncbi:MAG: nitroreductase family protein [Cyanobacteriota bacterium]
MEKIGDQFQQETKYYPDKNIGRTLDWYNQPEIYKNYPDTKQIELIKPAEIPLMSLHKILNNRKSIRNYVNKPLFLEELSYLLWASTGIQRIENGYEFRTVPSAGALYPIETYLVINNVKNVEAGLYHYL